MTALRVSRAWLRPFVARLYLLTLVAGSGTAFAQSAPSGFTSAHRYDLAGREVGRISPDPDLGGPLHYAAVRDTYDSLGNIVKIETGEIATWQSEDVAPFAWTGFSVFQTINLTYDIQGHKLSEAKIGSTGTIISLIHYSYDLVGRLQCKAVRMNPAAYNSLPASACALGAQGTQGPDRIERYTYDAAGQLIQVRKAVGTSLEQAEATYSYTPNGNQEYVIDANGNRAKLEYDGFDRLQTWYFPSATKAGSFDSSSQASALNTANAYNTSDYEQYAYDADGDRTSMRKRDGSVLNYDYDALNRVTRKVVPERSGLSSTHTRDVYYSYDLQGHQLTATFDSGSGEGISNAYDKFGRLTSTTVSIDGASRTISYQYDADGNRTRVSYPDGNYVTYGYDGLDRPLLIQRSGSGTLASYSYDAAGRRTAFNSSGIATGYSYDAGGRLATLSNSPVGAAAYYLTISGSGTCTDTAGSGAVCYNPAGQITEMRRSNNAFVYTGLYNVDRSYSVNGLNQYTQGGSASFGYDANGNLMGDGSNAFTYDCENRLVIASGAHNATLRYDPLGRLYEVAGGSGTTRFLYAGDELMAEYDGSGNLLRRYAHGADIAADDPIAWYEGSAFGSSNERQLRPDWEGSIVLVAASGGSNVLATNRYDEYGIPQQGNAGRFQYTGQAWLPELGMNYFKARMYSPTLGRFMQTDPIGYKDQINLYASVGDDPLNQEDPTGEHDRPTIVDFPNGHEVIYIPVKLVGSTPEAEASALAAAQAKAERITSADGNLSIRIEDADTVGASLPEVLDIASGKQQMAGNVQGEGIHTDTMQGHLDGSRADIGSTIPHDILHPFGVPDQYVYQRDANGRIMMDPANNPIVVRDPSNHNIMGPNLGNVFERGQLGSEPALQNPNIVHCDATDDEGNNCQ